MTRSSVAGMVVDTAVGKDDAAVSSADPAFTHDGAVDRGCREGVHINSHQVIIIADGHCHAGIDNQRSAAHHMERIQDLVGRDCHRMTALNGYGTDR